MNINSTSKNKMNKLLGQRKKFNLNISSSSSSGWSSSSDDDTAQCQAITSNKFNISLSIRDDGSLCILERTFSSSSSSDSSSAEEQEQVVDSYGETSDAFGSPYQVPKMRKQRTNSQRSIMSTRSSGSASSVPISRTNSDYVDDTSDDEAFMNNSANFVQSPSRPLRRSLRKRKTSSLKHRPGVQRVPESDFPGPVIEQEERPLRRSVSALDTTLDMDGDLSIEWIENETSDSQSGDLQCHVISEKSLLIANAETEDALSDYSDNHAGVFKMPFPVSYRPNLSKRKLIVESDEEFITSTFRAPVKRNCIRYYY